NSNSWLVPAKQRFSMVSGTCSLANNAPPLLNTQTLLSAPLLPQLEKIRPLRSQRIPSGIPEMGVPTAAKSPRLDNDPSSRTSYCRIEWLNESARYSLDSSGEKQSPLGKSVVAVKLVATAVSWAVAGS